MFKALSSFMKSKNAMWIFVVVVVLFIIYALSSYSNNKVKVRDNMYSSGVVPQQASSVYAQQPTPVIQNNMVQEVPQVHQVPQVQHVTAPVLQQAAALNPVANPDDLLPKDQNSQWAALNPVNNGSPNLPDLLQAGALIGLDPISNTLKNPTYDLRSDPIIPKQDVGPWNISTYEPDLGRVPFEIGAGSR
jgi:hypothetical protein